jgi:hypothetical protein
METRMADPAAATVNQLKNIQARTGRPVTDLLAAVAATGLAKHGERRSWLMEHFKLGYGDANAVVHFMDKPLPDLGGGGGPAPVQATADDPLDGIYTGAKAPLRALHQAVLQAVALLGPFEAAPKKAYVSLRRKKQFAMVGPATKDAVEIGLNAKDLPPHARLKPQPAGSMCNATTRISSVAEVDAALVGWLRQAFDAAG